MPDSVVIKLPVKFRSFSELNKIHQIECMYGQWDEDLHTMEVMCEQRMLNIRDEEEFLLPLYKSEIKKIPRGGALKFFIREHKLIKKNLDSMVRHISNIILNDSGNAVNLVKLFEGYHTFKDLLDHHDSRERVFLYRLPDEKTDIGNRELVLQEINARQVELMNKIGMPV